MRITNKMLSNDFLYDMNTNLQNLKTIQKQMSSGKEISKPSDDPFKVSRSMQLTTDINANKQYNQNILDASNFLQTTDIALDQAENVLQRIRELLVSTGNAGYDSTQLESVKDEINEKVGELSQVLNTNFDGKYIFGGTRGNTKPVDVLNPYVAKVSTVTSSSANAAAGSVSGNYTGGSAETLKIKIVTDGAPTPRYGYQVDTGSGFGSITYFSSDSTDNSKSQDIDIGNGLKFHLEASSSNKITDGTTYSFDVDVQKPSKNTQLIYYKKGGGELIGPVKAQVTETDLSSWQGSSLCFKVDGGADQTISIPASPALKTIDDLAASINTAVGANSDLNGKLYAKIAKDDLNNSYLKIYNVSSNSIILDSSTSGALSSYAGKQVGAPDLDMISSDLNVEISNGVTMKYNVTASDILQFTDASGDSKDLRSILSSIVNHLDGNNSTGSSTDSNAKSEITNGDMQDVTDAINNLLSVRSEIGAKENRMESAKSKNTDETDNMTEILSKTEDIDITEKTMEYATMQTVYLASLQTSAKVLQPTLLDYLR